MLKSFNTRYLCFEEVIKTRCLYFQYKNILETTSKERQSSGVAEHFIL